MLLRLRTPDGMFRLTLEKDDTFGDLGRQLLSKLPPTVDAKTITLSNNFNGGDSKRIAEIAKFKIGQVGLRQATTQLFVAISGDSKS
jgi:nuclear protein localization protein 4 homolog